MYWQLNQDRAVADRNRKVNVGDSDEHVIMALTEEQALWKCSLSNPVLLLIQQCGPNWWIERPITIWRRLSKGTYVHNHTELGHAQNEKPIPKTKIQESWSGDEWQRVHAWLDSNFKIVILEE